MKRFPIIDEIYEPEETEAQALLRELKPGESCWVRRWSPERRRWEEYECNWPLRSHREDVLASGENGCWTYWYDPLWEEIINKPTIELVERLLEVRNV